MDANPDFSAITTDDIENSITSLSANINAATFEQLMLIAEFDSRQGWGHVGVRSCAHWLNWRCGISTTTAREKLRVAHALQTLPLTRQAFATGELSYSKARAITRVGTVDNEEHLLSIARYGTASHLDRTVRLFRKQYVGVNGEIVDPLEAERQAAAAQYNQRQVDTFWDENGCLEIRAKLTAEQGAIVLKALEVALESIKNDEQDNEQTDATDSTQLHNEYPSENPPAGASDSEQERLLYRNRRADALVLMANQSLQNASGEGSTTDRFQVVVHVDSQVLSGEQAYKTGGGPDSYIENEVALPVPAARRLSCSCNKVTAIVNGSEPLNIGRSTRAIPTGIRRALAIRDTHCMFPGCDCTKYLDAHHIVHWSNGGETSMDNLMRVCHYHHVLLHEGGYNATRLATGELLFYKPDGSILKTNMEPAKSNDTINPSAEPMWHWSGDSMDYSMALYGIAKATESNSEADALV
jgi:hypothetical protein